MANHSSGVSGAPQLVLGAHYPDVPGFKVGGTSREAAEAAQVGAELLRFRVFQALKAGPSTADECACRIGESVLSVRPRMTELKAMGKVIDTGVRRKNASGRRAAVWAPVLVQGGLL